MSRRLTPGRRALGSHERGRLPGLSALGRRRRDRAPRADRVLLRPGGRERPRRAEGEPTFLEAAAASLALPHAKGVCFIKAATPAVCATAVRGQLRRGEPVEGLVPEGAAEIIRALGLYGCAAASAAGAAARLNAQQAPAAAAA